MLKRAVVAMSILSLVSFGFVAVVVAQPAPTGAASLIVKLVQGLSAEQQAAAVLRCGGVEISTIPALRLHTVSVSAESLDAAILCYQADSEVQRVEVNQVRQAEAVPNDVYYLPLPGGDGQWHLPMIGWDKVFGSVTPLGTAKVAILDTGVDSTHPDLQDKLYPGFSVFDGNNGLSDPNGHGTFLAGIVAAATGNGIGIAGVAFEGVMIVPVTVLGADGTGQDSDVIAGVIWAADHGADVILMGFSNPGSSASLQEAIDYAWERGAVLVAATGNAGSAVATFPAGHRSVMGVSATDQYYALAISSNYGPAVFIAAPGADIITTAPNSLYATVSGTSASAAIIAGVAGFMKAVDPTLTNGVIVGRLARTADSAGTLEQTGNGRVNMARALADIGTDFVQPAGAPGGGPFVGPYVAASFITPQTVPVGTTVTMGFNGLAINCETKLSLMDGTNVLHTWGPILTNANGEFNYSLSIPYDLTPNMYLFRVDPWIGGQWTQYNIVYFWVVAEKTNPIITMSSSPNPSVVGQPVTFTVTVSAVPPDTRTPTGTVQFMRYANGWITFGQPVVLVGNIATSISISTLQPSMYNYFAAEYSGDNTFNKVTFYQLFQEVLAQPTVMWFNPADIVYGTALGATQLTATANTVGTFAYNPPAGTVLEVGNHTLSVVFTPLGGGNSASASVAIHVGKAPVTLTAGSGSATYDGATHAPSACVVTGAYTGDLTCANTPASVGPDVGTTPIVPVVSGAGLGNFEVTKVNGSYTIGKAPVTLTAGSGSASYDGAMHAPSACAVTGAYTGDLTCANTPASVGPDAGTTPIVPVVSGTGLGNFEMTAINGSYTIGKAAVTATAGGGSASYDGVTTHVPPGCAVTGVYTGDLMCANNPASVGPAAGTTPIVPVVSGTGLGNFEVTAVNGSYTIGNDSTTVVTCPASVIFDGSAQTPCTVAVTGAGGLSLTPTPSYANNTDAGTATASYTYAGDANHTGSSDSKTFTIVKAASTTTVTCPTSVIYSGAAQTPCTATVTGAGGLEQPLPVNHTNSTDVGLATAEASYAGDTNHTGSSTTATFNIYYNWTGFLQPINDTAHQVDLKQSKFRLGQTIPAKFVLKNAAGTVVQQTGNPAFSSESRGTCENDTQDESVGILLPNTGGEYKWDGSQYHYNWNTRGLTSGKYRIYATLADGTKQWVDICLMR